MRIEEDIFAKKRAARDRLLAFGFTEDGDQYKYLCKLNSEELEGSDFDAEITVSKDGTVTGKVTDADTGDPFELLHVEAPVGSFAAAVREAYRDQLVKIADSCFLERAFYTDQANRLAAYLEAKYGEYPDDPFAKFDGLVYRYPENGKWYAFCIYVPGWKLKKGTTEEPMKGVTELTEAITVKADTEEIPELLKHPAVYQGFGMDHKHWISVVTDGTLPDEKLFELAEKSREYAKKGSGGKAYTYDEEHTWLVPSNPKYFDIIAAFEQSPDLGWKQAAKVRTGDTVFLYSGMPNGAILYRCTVTETDLPADYHGEVDITKEMMLHLEQAYPKDFMTREHMRDFGVVNCRGQRHMPQSMIDAFREWENGI